MALALKFLHSKGVLHRDFKPANVLVDNEGHVALTDYGMAASLQTRKRLPFGKASLQFAPLRGFYGTPNYVAPELLSRPKSSRTNDHNCTTAVDWWSLGCTLYELLSGRTPFDPATETCPQKPVSELFWNILHKEPVFDGAVFDGEARSLLGSLLHKEPTRRATVRRSFR